MKVFLDANVLIAVLNKEYPLFTYASRVLSLAGSATFQIYTSPVCLAIAFYFAEKKSGAKKAKEKIDLLCAHIRLAPDSHTAVLASLQNKKILDLEDGLGYYAAVEADCNCMVNERVDDFHFSNIEVLRSEAFFIKYLMKAKPPTG